MISRQRQTARQQSDGHDGPDSVDDDYGAQQHQTKGKRSISTVLTLKPKQQRRAPLDGNRPLLQKEKSIYDMNMIEIGDAFKAQLFGQDETLDRLSAILYEFNQQPQPLHYGGTSGDMDVPLILPLMLAGVSGVGKTATAKLLRQLYQVGTEQYIKYDLTRITDDTQINIILGAGPGLVGSTSRTNLPMSLMRAIGRAPRGKQDVDLTEDAYQQQLHYHSNSDANNATATPPRTILLHFDEVDKAHPKFMTLMLNFIEEGELTSSSDVKFVLPPQTRLVIVFTGNYAEHDIEPLCQMRHYREAQQLVRLAIEVHGVPRAVLGRLSHILPYFQLEPAIVKRISDCMVTSILGRADHAYRNLFGYITYDTESCDTVRMQSESKVIDVIKSNYMIGDGGTALGMRGLNNGLKEFRSMLYAGIATYLLRHSAQQQQQLPQQQQQQASVIIDLTETRCIDYGGGRTTRSQSMKQLSTAVLVNNTTAQVVPKVITPHLSYRVFTYPSDMLAELRRLSPGAFSRSVQCNIDERVHRQQDVGLVMVYSFRSSPILNNNHGTCAPDPILLYCMLNEHLATVRPTNNNALALVVYPPVVHNDMAQRRLLSAPRHARCGQCSKRHSRSEPCPLRHTVSSHDGALMDVDERCEEEEEDVAMPEFSFSRISQFYKRPLVTNNNTTAGKTSKRTGKK